MTTPADPKCHVCGPAKQENPSLFCGPCAIERIRATHLPAASLVEVETTHGRIHIRTDPQESAEHVAARAERAIAHLATTSAG